MHSKDLIAMSLYELLYKGIPLDKITVTSLCEKANVSRMSFYRSFNNVQDVIVTYCDDRFEEFFKIISEKMLTIEELLYEIFTFLRKYKRQFVLLAQYNLQTMLLDQLFYYVKYVSQKYSEQYELDIALSQNKFLIPALTGALYMVIIQWTRDNMSQSVDSVVEDVMDMFRHINIK